MPTTSKTTGSLFRGRAELKQRVESIEQAKGLPLGSTVAKIKKRKNDRRHFATSADFADALAELQAVAAVARKSPTAANLRRVEIAAKSTAKSLSQQRMEAREAARNARPDTSTLNTFTNLSGPQAATYYKANRSAIHSEQTALALWQQRQNS